jgi:dihydrofolate reductase
MDANRVLGGPSGIPWRLPADTAHFRAYTAGKWLLLGRRTYLEMLGWFRPDQTPLILTSEAAFVPRFGRAVSCVPEALELAQGAGVPELVNCGGASTYLAAMPYTHRMVLTRIEYEVPPARELVHFPEWPESEWRLESATHHAPDQENALAFAVENWVRRD